MDILDLKWTPTGQTVPFPQYELELRLVKDYQRVTVADLRKSQGKSVLFPNVLNNLTAAERAWFIEKVEDALIQIYVHRHQED